MLLSGSSFAPDPAGNEVFVGGRRCEVLEASQNRLVCKIPSWGAAGIGDSSMRGLRYKRHDIRRRRRWTISEMPPEAERPVDEDCKDFAEMTGATLHDYWNSSPSKDEADGYLVVNQADMTPGLAKPRMSRNALPIRLRLGLKVSGLSVAAGEDGELLDAGKVSGMTKISPAMELQAIRLSGIDVRREQHFIEIGNTTVNASFRLRLFGAGGHQAFLSFHHGVHRNTIRNEVRNAKVVLAGQAPFALHGCRSITVDTVPLLVAPKVRFLLTFHCALEAASTQWIDMELVEAPGGNVTVGKLQNASAPVSGTFRVGHSGSWTGDLDAQRMSSRWWELTAAISSLRRSSEDRGGFQVLVRFRRPIGDVAPLQVHTTGFPAEFRLEVFTIEDGDADAIFLEKIPADLFQVPLPDPESETLQVVTEGIVGAFGGSEVLGYQYSHDLVPTIFSAEPTHVNATDHLTLVISGLQRNSSDGWVDDLQVLIGDDAGLCGDHQEVQDSDNDTGVETGVTVICKLSDVAAGDHQVHLISVSQGKANPDTAPLISVDLVLEDFQPHFGSLAPQDEATRKLVIMLTTCMKALAWSFLFCFVIMTIWAMMIVEIVHPHVKEMYLTEEVFADCADCLQATESLGLSLKTPGGRHASAAVRKRRAKSAVFRRDYVLVGGRPCSQPFLGAAPMTSGKAGESGRHASAAVRKRRAKSAVFRRDYDFQPHFGSLAWAMEDLSEYYQQQPADPVDIQVVWIYAAMPVTIAQPPRSASLVRGEFVYKFGSTPIVQAQPFIILKTTNSNRVVLSIAGAGFHPESAKHFISLSPADGAHALECLVIAGNSTHLDCRLQGSAAKIVAQQLLTEETSAGPTRSPQLDPSGPRKQEVRCFAKALANAGSVRSQPSETASGRVSEALDFLRRVEADDLAMEVATMDALTTMSTAADVSLWVLALREWTPPQSQGWIDLSHNQLDEHDAADILDTVGTNTDYINLAHNNIKSLSPIANFLQKTVTGMSFQHNDLSLADHRQPKGADYEDLRKRLLDWQRADFIGGLLAPWRLEGLWWDLFYQAKAGPRAAIEEKDPPEDWLATFHRSYNNEDLVVGASHRSRMLGRGPLMFQSRQATTETDTICARDLKLYVERILRLQQLAPETSFHIRLVLNGKTLPDDVIISGGLLATWRLEGLWWDLFYPAKMGDAVFEEAVAMDGGYGDREGYQDGYSSDGDGYGDQYDPVADLETGMDEASRRLRDAAASVPIEIQIRPRWGIESDAAEDFRLAHMRPIRKRRSRQRDPPAVQLRRRLMSEEEEDDDLNDTSSDANVVEETEVGSDDSDEPEVASEGTESSELGSDDSDDPEVVVPPILAISEILDLDDSALEDDSGNLTETDEEENASNSSNSSLPALVV
ncbi:hypothetical protein AK812_SmicGene28166 [Symbiodinium microadriaticum]|uniref:Uncharacterized protein n=1 Tax=Symbiodinium microadriaticum TaxID=2951 RepID=A0A1Q9D596_SYMMI|nr:hypothetical protein AK812_SmicGene28166 [Symbiodinium microadriaticum]